MTKRIVLDAEFDSLEPTRCWCVVVRDIDDETWTRTFRSPDGLQNLIDRCTIVVGHNIIGFDTPHLKRLWSINIPHRRTVDTLIVSRLVHYARLGGHSIESYAKEFGLSKPPIDVYDDASRIDEYVHRCEEDTRINVAVFRKLERFVLDPDWKPSLRLEHDTELVCLDMHTNGFPFDYDGAQGLMRELKERMNECEEAFQKEIPKRIRPKSPILLRLLANGRPSKKAIELSGCTDDSDLCVSNGAEFHRFEYVPFNPGSTKDRIEFLNSCGWKPVEKTKTHIVAEREYERLSRQIDRLQRRGRNRFTEGKLVSLRQQLVLARERLLPLRESGWKCSETNLQTLPPDAPGAAHLLAEWLALAARHSDLEEWCAAFRPSTGRIHGSYRGIGSWTHRKSHVRPNQGNIFSAFDVKQCLDPSKPSAVERVKLEYNATLRDCWGLTPSTDPKGELALVGTDAEAIQLRILAHYCNDEEMINAITRGSKADGTDIHSVNMRKLGSVCSSRDVAKTFIYAFLLGAGIGKIQEILSCGEQQARDSVELFLRDTPGLLTLKRDTIPSVASDRFFVGLDGRKVVVTSEHLVLAGLLQNGESICMKTANLYWRKSLEEKGVWFEQVNDVHDEWVTLCKREDVEIVGKEQCNALVRTGNELGLNCPLAGETKHGRTWLDVH